MIARLVRKVVPDRWKGNEFLTRHTRAQCGSRVQRGPFAGMRYIERAADSAYLQRLLGIYERELHGVVEKACALGLAQIVNPGAAEGYYAVGMALRNPQARVLAFERDPQVRSALVEMVRINSVGDRLQIGGFCGMAELNASLEHAKGKTLVVCDIEGGEEVLLDPQAAPGLRSCWMLVEVHEFVKRGIGDTLMNRFSTTHRVEQIWQEPRSASEYPFKNMATRLLPRRYLEWAVREPRPERMSWLWMEPRQA